MTWEPLSTVKHLRDELAACSARLAAVPSLAMWAAPSPTGCCFGTACRTDDAELVLAPCGMCGAKHHHLCATEHKLLQPVLDKLDGRFCFECALLAASVTKAAPCGLVGARALFGPYYEQVDVASLEQPSPLALGGMLTCGALTLKDAASQPVRGSCRRTPSASSASRRRASCAHAASAPPCCTTLRCVCLQETRSAASLTASRTKPSFPWCCPRCFAKGKAAWLKLKSAPKRKAPAAKRGRGRGRGGR